MSSIWVDLLGSEVRFYDAGGVRTRCIEAGDGHPVIFLHGVGGHAEAFARNIMPLSQNFRAIAVDYLGFGLTDKPAEAPSSEDYVRHLVDFMDAAGIEKAHLVGESLGGWVSFWTALLHPERVGKLISVCGARLETEADEESQRHVDAGRAELQRLTQQFVDDPTRENVRARLHWLFRDPDRDVTEELVDVRWAIYQQASAQRQLRKTATRLIAQQPTDIGFTPERLAQIQHPTLMLWTDHNPSTTAATARNATQYLSNGSFELMEDSAHWPQWEHPDTFNRIVTEYLMKD
jgi:2-hydroxy-6-oxonona-2,4-dienedioate hydrolase